MQRLRNPMDSPVRQPNPVPRHHVAVPALHRAVAADAAGPAIQHHHPKGEIVNDDYRQGWLDVLAAVHGVLADIGMEITHRPAGDEADRQDRMTKMATLTEVSRRICVIQEALA